MPEIISGFFSRPKNDTVMPGSTDVTVAPASADTTVAEPEQAPADTVADGTTGDAEDRTDTTDAEAPAEDAADESADDTADDVTGDDTTGEEPAEDAENVDEDGEAEPVTIEADAPPVAEETDEDAAADADAGHDAAAADQPVADETRPAAGVRGSTTVDDAVVTKVVTIVAGKIDGVHRLDDEALSVEVADDIATIKVSFVVEFGHPVKALAEQVRVGVIEAVEQFLGLDVATVDVHISDIHQPEA